jgi:hypothetical protein
VNKAYRVWDLTKNKIVVTRDVLFHKHSSPSAPSSSSSSSSSSAYSTPSPVTILFSGPSHSSLPALVTSNPQPLAPIPFPCQANTTSDLLVSLLHQTPTALTPTPASPTLFPHASFSISSDSSSSSFTPTTPNSLDSLNHVLKTRLISDLLNSDTFLHETSHSLLSIDNPPTSAHIGD